MSLVRGSPDKKGFTLVELMVAAAITAVLFAALFMTLTIGDLSYSINTEKIDLQAKVRMLSSWITNDVRQAVTSNIHSHDPSADHIKFNLWAWNNTSEDIQIDTDNSTEYEYDSVNQKLFRRTLDADNDTVQEWEFDNITQSPFYTQYTNDTENDFEPSELLVNRKLIVVISSEKAVKDRLLNSTLIEEVKIRNE